MKHTFKITLFLIALFFAAQVVGLEAVRRSIDIAKFSETGNVSYTPLMGNISRPEVGPTSSVLWIFAAIIIGTIIVFILMFFRQRRVWKVWFLLSVVVTLSFAFYAFFRNSYIALAAAIVLALWKVYRPNLFVHNITEVFIYGGIAVIFVPIMNILAGVILLILISAYDMYAVWKSKHMIKLAKFQTKTNVFAGLFVPYKALPKPEKGEKIIVKKVRTAVLGGGDIGFPLIFTGIIMTNLIMKYGFSAGFLMSLIVTICATMALTLLFIKSEKDKFYPAMPFLSAGCFAGYLIILLVQNLM
jgi:presenilin-like A22 family membrane protease